MNMLKLTAAAALVAASLSASAMTTINDEELSSVSGQDGVSIAANLNINIGSFSYTNTTDANATVNFNNISVKGLIAMTVDVISNATFQADIANSSSTVIAPGVTAGQALLAAVNSTAGYGMAAAGTDVVQFAFPTIGDGKVAHGFSPTITVGSITMSGSSASFGQVALKNFDLQGTQVWMWAH